MFRTCLALRDRPGTTLPTEVQASRVPSRNFVVQASRLLLHDFVLQASRLLLHNLVVQASRLLLHNFVVQASRLLPSCEQAGRLHHNHNDVISKLLPAQVFVLVLAICTAIAAPALAQDDPLPSWNDAPAKRAIIAFVDEVTKEGTPSFVPVSERIAALDNDGTLWCEQPMYVQAAFAVYRVKALASGHPEWKEQQPFKAVLEGDMKAVFEEGARAATAILAATHAGMTKEEFEPIVLDWLATARHPRFGRPYTELAYQPMRELLIYLRQNDFKTYIVSGGGVDFMRPWTSRVYGIPPEQVIGSAIKLKYELRDGQPVVMRLPEVDFIDDRAGKPVGIQKVIGRRPIAAFGNSDGDYEMLRWTTAGKGPRLGLIVHHTDETREYAYDRHSAVGRLDRALEEAPARGWVVVDMKNDWTVVFADRKKE